MVNQDIIEQSKDIKLFIEDKEISGADKEAFINVILSIEPKSKKAMRLISNGYAFDLFLFFLRGLFRLEPSKRWKEISAKTRDMLIGRMLAKIGFDGPESFKVVHENRSFLFPFPVRDEYALSFLLNELPGYLSEYNIREKDVVLDLGTYHGWFSIYASKLVGDSGKIIAFEPDSKNLIDLKRNLKLNDPENIILVEKGTWDKTETVSFKEDSGGSRVCDNCETKINVTALDQELKELKIPFESIKFIKMDIEGAELETIDGMNELLSKGKPSLAIASYHVRDGEKTCYKAEEKLKKLGYHVKTGYPSHLTTYAWKD
jgi:FkbM family methyltransferase